MAFGFAVHPMALYLHVIASELGWILKRSAMLRVYQTAGLAFIFIPSNVLSYVGMPREKNNQVSSMMNFVRNIGGSIGIALVGTYRDAHDAKTPEQSIGENAGRQSEISRRCFRGSPPPSKAMD